MTTRRSPRRSTSWSAAFKARGSQVVVGDALNPSAVTQAAQGVEHIISLVAVRRNRPQSYLAVNVDGARILGQAAKAAGVLSVIFVSAIGARLDQHYKYLTSRWMGEQELGRTGVPGTILRFSFVLAEEGGDSGVGVIVTGSVVTAGEARSLFGLEPA